MRKNVSYDRIYRIILEETPQKQVICPHAGLTVNMIYMLYQASCHILTC